MRIRKRLITGIMLTAIVLLFAACGDQSSEKSGVSVVTNNDLAVNLLTSSMTPFKEASKDGNLLDAAKTKINDDSFDFSELTYSEDTVSVGGVVYVEGVIPQEDYPADKITVFSDPEEKVSFENVYLTNKDGDTVLTFDVVGEKAGSAEINVGLDDSEYNHYFDLEITETASRSMPASYTVYCTPTGEKYHAYGCGYLRGNGIAISLDDALSKGLGPCSRCNP